MTHMGFGQAFHLAFAAAMSCLHTKLQVQLSWPSHPRPSFIHTRGKCEPTHHQGVWCDRALQIRTHNIGNFQKLDLVVSQRWVVSRPHRVSVVRAGQSRKLTVRASDTPHLMAPFPLNSLKRRKFCQFLPQTLFLFCLMPYI